MSRKNDYEFTIFMLEHITSVEKDRWYVSVTCSILEDFYKENNINRGGLLTMIINGEEIDNNEFNKRKEEYFEKRFKEWKNDKTRDK